MNNYQNNDFLKCWARDMKSQIMRQKDGQFNRKRSCPWHSGGRYLFWVCIGKQVNPFPFLAKNLSNFEKYYFIGSIYV